MPNSFPLYLLLSVDFTDLQKKKKKKKKELDGEY